MTKLVPFVTTCKKLTKSVILTAAHARVNVRLLFVLTSVFYCLM